MWCVKFYFAKSIHLKYGRMGNCTKYHDLDFKPSNRPDSLSGHNIISKKDAN